MMAWRRPIGRANAISSGHWSSGWKSRVMRSMSCFGSTHIQVITIPKRKVGNFVGRELSPLFANVYLDRFDKMVLKHSLKLVRYADDCLFCCRSQADADAALEYARKCLARLDLAVNPRKTTIYHAEKGLHY